MVGLSAGKFKFLRTFSFIPVALMMVALLLTACGSDQPTATLVPVTAAPTTTAANTPLPPTRQPTKAPAPTATSDVARVFNSPAPSPPPLFPTATGGPAVTQPNFTATASVPDLNLTPAPTTATGQLAFVQAGNLWLIDNNGGNRLQLTNAGDIDPTGLVAWSPFFDRVVYQARTGELYTVDTTGQRDLIFAPGKTARLGNSATLPPLPTALPSQPVTTTNRAPVNLQIQPGKTITDLSWSADGHFIAFTYFNGDLGTQSSGEVWVAEIISGKAALARVSEGFSPTWGPDSHTLAFLTRPTVKQGQPIQGNQGQTPTPRGTSLLPPTVVILTPSSQGNLGALQAQDTPAAGFSPATTPGVTPTTVAAVTTPASNSPDPNATPTPFILRPGGNTTPNPTNPNQVPSTPFPTPTSNIVSLPSPTPTPTYPPVFNGTYQGNQIGLYSTLDHSVKLLAESNRLPSAYNDLTGTLRSYIPAPFEAVWFSPDGRFVAFSDQLSVVGIVPVGGGDPVTWTGSPQGYAVYQVTWLPRADAAFIRWGNPYSTDLSRLSLITFNNLNANGGGIPGDVTNPKLVKITDLPGPKVSCAALSPDGQFFSYYDGTTMVITRSDGSIYQSVSDTECTIWSPFGRDYASIKKTGDRSIVLTNLDQPAPKEIISTGPSSGSSGCGKDK